MVRRWVLAFPAIALGLILMAPGAAQAQFDEDEWGEEEETDFMDPEFRYRVHLYLGGQLSGILVPGQEGEPSLLNDGIGGGLFAGIRFGPMLSIEGNWSMTSHDDSALSPPGSGITIGDSLYLSTLSVDGKLHLPNPGALEPYFQFGIGGFWITDRDHDAVIARGLAINAGGGLDIWLGPWVSVGARVLYRRLEFREAITNVIVLLGEEDHLNTVSFDLNLTLHL